MTPKMSDDVKEVLKETLAKLQDIHTWLDTESAEIGGHDLTTEGHHDIICAQCQYNAAVNDLGEICNIFHDLLYPQQPKKVNDDAGDGP